MSEFSLTGYGYVSEWNGDSLNVGTDPDTPWAHPADAPNSVSNEIIVGSGYYEGGWGAQDRRLTGDGKVIIDFLGFEQQSYSNTLKVYKNIHFKNSPLFGIASTLGRQIGHSNTILENITAVSMSHATSHSVLFIGLSTYTLWGQVLSLESSSFLGNLNFNASNISNFKYNYVQGNLVFLTAFTSTQLNTGLQHNVINGTITIGGNNYELKKLKDGSTRPDANGSLLDFATYYPNVYTNGNFAGDPKFVDFLSRVVEPDSDLLTKQGTYGFIGGVSAGKAFLPDSGLPNMFYSFSGVTEESAGEYRITGDEGYVELIVKISGNPTRVPKIHYIGELAFAGDAPDNVPDYFPELYSTLSASGLKPNHLTFKMRTSIASSKPTFDSEWDNDPALGTTAGLFYDQKWEVEPTITDVGGVKYGNANPLVIGGSPSRINARWVHIKVRLTNLRYF